MNLLDHRVALSSLLIGLAATTATAQDGDGISVGNGGVRLHGSIDTKVVHTDNRFRTESNTESETGLQIDPTLALAYSPGDSKYAIGYRGHIDHVVEDTYADAEYFIAVDSHPAIRHRFELDASYKYGHDELGLVRTENLTNPDDLHLDKWRRSKADTEYTFGSPNALLNVSARTGLSNIQYETNRALTEPLDHEVIYVGFGVAIRVSPKTRVIVDYEQQTTDYDIDAGPSFDSTQTRALTGLRWQATAKTRGEVLVGYFGRDFDASERRDRTGVDWRARVFWLPVPRTQFTFATGRLLRETYLAAGEDFINDTLLGAEWRQDFSSRFYSVAAVEFHELAFEGSARDDDLLIGRGSFHYRLTYALKLNAGFEVRYRESSIVVQDFDRTDLFIGFDYAL